MKKSAFSGSKPLIFKAFSALAAIALVAGCKGDHKPNIVKANPNSDDSGTFEKPNEKSGWKGISYTYVSFMGVQEAQRVLDIAINESKSTFLIPNCQTVTVDGSGTTRKLTITSKNSRRCEKEISGVEEMTVVRDANNNVTSVELAKGEKTTFEVSGTRGQLITISVDGKFQITKAADEAYKVEIEDFFLELYRLTDKKSAQKFSIYINGTLQPANESAAQKAKFILADSTVHHEVIKSAKTTMLIETKITLLDNENVTDRTSVFCGLPNNQYLVRQKITEDKKKTESDFSVLVQNGKMVNEASKRTATKARCQKTQYEFATALKQFEERRTSSTMGRGSDDKDREKRRKRRSKNKVKEREEENEDKIRTKSRTNKVEDEE